MESPRSLFILRKGFCRFFLLELFMFWKRPLLFLLIGTLSTACLVPKTRHEETLDQLEATRIQLANTERDKADLEERLTTEIEHLEARIATLEGEKSTLETELAEARTDLELYGTRKGSLEEALEANRQELNELRRARQQTEARLQVFRDLAAQLASMIEAGQLSVSIRDGRMVINLADDILFDSGRTEIKTAGQSALQELSLVLREIPDRNFLVAGHTDNIPIRSGRFRSNWELSTARAVTVVEYLQAQGVSPQNLAAAGYGEFDPIASNESPETRALNRRIEIILMPNIGELPSVPDDLLHGS